MVGKLSFGHGLMKTARRGAFGNTNANLESLGGVPLDHLAITIIKENPEILPDLRKALSVIRRNSKRMGISRRYEIEGSADNDIPEIKAVWIRVHIGEDATPEKMVSTSWELDSLILREFACKLSTSMVMVAVGA
jgi:hypothetical protein